MKSTKLHEKKFLVHIRATQLGKTKMMKLWNSLRICAYFVETSGADSEKESIANVSEDKCLTNSNELTAV